MGTSVFGVHVKLLAQTVSKTNTVFYTACEGQEYFSLLFSAALLIAGLNYTKQMPRSRTSDFKWYRRWRGAGWLLRVYTANRNEYAPEHAVPFHYKQPSWPIGDVSLGFEARRRTQTHSFALVRTHTGCSMLISGNHDNLQPHSGKVPGRTLAACCQPINNRANKTPVLRGTKCSTAYAK